MRTNLSPKMLARAIGVSESSVKRWADEGAIRAARTNGGHRRIAIAEAVRFIRRSSLPVIRPELLGAPEVSEALPSGTAPGSDLGDADRLHDLLIDGRSFAARGLILGRYLAGARVAALCDGPIRQALARIGERWRGTDDGIFIEHRATEICAQALAAVRVTLDPGEGPVAVGGGGPDDPYRLPSSMAAVVLEESGFRAVDLGAQTPLVSLRQGVGAHAARLAWLSLSAVVADPGVLARGVDRLARELQGDGVRLVVGGRARAVLGRPRRGLFVAESMAELSAFATALVEADR